MAYRRIVPLLFILIICSQPVTAESKYSELEIVGKALYAKDQAAWLATDLLVENGQLPKRLQGWVTIPAENGWRVLFVEKEGKGYCCKYSVCVDESGVGPLKQSKTCEPLISEQIAMFQARQVAISALQERCSENYNTIVLPHEGSEAAWAVYLLAATQEPDTVVLGGHVRVLVNQGGTDIVAYQPLSKVCLTQEMPSANKGNPATLLTTHVLDDHPIETHVFLSLLHKIDIYVMTESAMWNVVEGRINLLMDGDDFKAYLERAKAAYEEGKGTEDSTQP